MKLKDFAINKPKLFDYLINIQDDILTNRKNIIEHLKEIKTSLKQKEISNEWLKFSKNGLDKLINYKLNLVDFIIQANQNEINNNLSDYDKLFEILNSGFRTKISFYKTEMPLVIKRQIDTDSTNQVIINKLSAYVNDIEDNTEDLLIELGKTKTNVRNIVIKLLLNRDISFSILDTDYKKYSKIIRLQRLETIKTISEIGNLENYLKYTKNKRKQYSDFLDIELEKLHNKTQNKFIIDAQMEKNTNLDNIRIEFIKTLQDLKQILKDKPEELELEQEISKLKSNTYQIAVIASMKAGKSTLTNSMLGQELLPALVKSCTGRLTYINNSENETYVNISLKSNNIVISCERAIDLETFINKYEKKDWISEIKVSCSAKLEISNSIIYSDKYFLAENKEQDIYINQAEIKIKNGINKFQIDNPTQKDLGCFINNDSVSKLEINTPITHLKKHFPIDNVQIIDTPGPNSASNLDHKRITYDFIDKANAVIFVIDVTHFPNNDDAKLLKDVKEIREQFNKHFYDKFFFVVNKIDTHNKNDDGDLDDRLLTIKNTIKEFGYNVPDNHFIAVSAKAGSLYRLFKAKMLDENKEKQFSSFWAPFVNDFSDVKSIEKAKHKILEFSRIDNLEYTISNYLKNSNLTKELIKDANKKAYLFASNYRDKLKIQKARAKKPLKSLEDEYLKLNNWIKETEIKKKEINIELQSNSTKLLKNILVEFEKFENLTYSVINIIYGANIQNDNSNIEVPNLEKVRSAINKFSQRANSQSELKKHIKNYNKAITVTLQSYYSNFEAHLKTFATKKRENVYDTAYQSANNVLQDLNKKIGKNLDIEINTKKYIFPPLSLNSVVNITDQVYKSMEERDKTWQEGGFCSSGKWLVSKIIYHRINIPEVKTLTLTSIEKATKITKGAIKKLINRDSEEMIENIFNSIDKHTSTLRKNLLSTMEQRKTVGFNVEKELEIIENKLNSIDETIYKLDILTKKI